jgi:hypothetical protein
MPVRYGTRNPPSTSRNGTLEGGSITRAMTGDLGMSKNVTASVTFASAGARATAANGTFAAFAARDEIQVEGANLNNGYFVVTGIDGTNHAFLVLDPAPKNEGPVTVTIRTT